MSVSEPTVLAPSVPAPEAEVPATAPKTHILDEGFQESTGNPVSMSAESSDVDPYGDDEATIKDPKRETKKKKKGEPVPILVAGLPNPSMALATAHRTPIQSPSPSRANDLHQFPSSPNRNLYSSSPRIVSPAGSQIFERDVQESSLPVPNSPAIPSHIQTENHIPSVLDASSEAITNDKLDPDTVEIVMHTFHQPAAVTVKGMGGSELTPGPFLDDFIAHTDKEDSASNYGALDNADIRRLSFISFSDIVQSEHAEQAGARDSFYVAGLSQLSTAGLRRSPSPIRSPVSSQGFGTSPPTSKSASVKGVDLSPSRKQLGSPISSQPPLGGGELTIETMSQALRKTASGDLSGFRSLPLSPISPDGLYDRSFR